MNVDYNSKSNYNYNEYLPSILPAAEEKFSNIKIIDQKPIHYQESPFESRKNQRKNIKQKIKNDSNSEYSEDRSENLNKNKKKIEAPDYVKKPYYTTNREYKNIKISPDYSNQAYYNTNPNRIQQIYPNRQKNIDENGSKKSEDIKNYHMENSLHNVSFSNKNIDTNAYNKEYEKIKAQVDPKILKQFRLIREMESNRKIIKLEREKEKLARENKKLSKSFNNFNKEREKFELEKKRFIESKNRVLNDTKKYEERLMKLEDELQNKYLQKKNEIEEMRNKLKEAHSNLEGERQNLRNAFQTKLTELENDYKLKEENNNYNNNLNIDKTKRDQEILRQKEREIDDLKNAYIKRENDLKMKENELKQKEIELQNKEYDYNNKIQNLSQEEQNLMKEKEQFFNNTEENQNNYNIKSQELNNKEQELLNKENQLITRENELKNKENEIQNKENLINNQENELNNRQNELISKQNELDDKQNEIVNQQNEINEKEKQINLLNKEIQNKQNQIIELNNQYNNMISNKDSPKSNKNNFQNVMKGPMDSQMESRPSISVKRIQKKNFGIKNSNNIPNTNNINNNSININQVENFEPIKNSNMSNKHKDIKDNDDYPENNLNDINDNDNYPENNLNNINDNDNYPENNLDDIKDNDDFPENNLDDIKDNDDFPENQLNDIKDNDNFPENHLNDIKDNDNFPENHEENNFMNDNKPTQQKQVFNDDEAFYGDIPNEYKSNENDKNEEEDMFQDVGNDFEQYINNQNDSQQTNNEKSIKEKYNPNDGDIQGKGEYHKDLDIFAEDNNDLMKEQFPDNILENNRQQINDKNNIINDNSPINNEFNQKQSEENFSLDLSSKNHNLPDFQENNSINKQNKNSQDLKDSNNINQNNNQNNLEFNEGNLNDLNLEEDMNKNNINNNKNELDQIENEKDSAIEQIMEELYIEEYNPSLGMSKNDNQNYINAVIQCFAHIPDITNKIINLHLDEFFENNLPKLKLVKRYRNLLINLFFPEKIFNMNRDPYNTHSFMNTLYELNPLFQNNENIEVKEFINYLILKLHDELNTKKNSSANQSSNDNINKNMENKNENDALVDFLQNFTTKNNSIISKTLYGISKYTFYCHQCQKSFFNFQCYSYLYFNLNDIIEYKQNKYRKDDVEINLNDCFDYYQRSETLRGDKGLYCPSCLEQTESTSIKNIYSTKNVLIIILDRKSGNNFNECKFDLKEVTNLRDYVQYKKEGEKTREKFFLGGVVNYIGDNYGNETYSAFIKMGKNNEWYCYDDENVYPTSFQDITNNGYPIILFYHKLTQK